MEKSIQTQKRIYVKETQIRKPTPEIPFKIKHVTRPSMFCEEGPNFYTLVIADCQNPKDAEKYFSVLKYINPDGVQIFQEEVPLFINKKTVELLYLINC